jgi:hypothetical protein
VKHYLATAAVTAALALAGCSSASAPAATAGTPADPVAILRATGAAPDPGTVYGSHDVQGDRMASGTYPGGEQVTVYASADQAAFAAEQSRAGQGDDLHGVVTIPGQLAVITVTAGLDAAGAPQWDATPAQIAGLVHGLVITPP